MRNRPPADARFTRADLERAFDPGTLKRGLDYQRKGAVVDLGFDDDDDHVIYAAVQGSERDPYEVEATIRRTRRGEPLIEGFCTCPVSYNCKHVAAALLAVLERGAQPEPQMGEGQTEGLSGPAAAWLRTLEAVAAGPGGALPADEAVIYVLTLADTAQGRRLPAITPTVAKRRKSGGWGSGRPISFFTLTNSQARGVTADDRTTARIAGSSNMDTDLPQEPALVDALMERLAGTGRLVWGKLDGPVLALGPARAGGLGWATTERGEQRPILTVPDGAEGVAALPLASPYYVDPAAGVMGKLTVPLAPAVLRAVMTAPPLRARDAAAVSRALRQRLPHLDIPPPSAEMTEVVVADPPVPVLTLSTEMRPSGYWPSSGKGAAGSLHDLMHLTFDYGGTMVDPTTAPQELRSVDGRRVIVRERNVRAEKGCFNTLRPLGVVAASYVTVRRPGFALSLPDENGWPDFLHRAVPMLEAEGWRVVSDPSFRHRLVAADGEWSADFDDQGSGWWFSLDLGIEVEGERIPLLPVLVAALKRLRPGEGVETLAHGGTLYTAIGNGRILALPFERVRAVLAVLVELFDGLNLGDDGRLAVSLGQADGLAAIADAVKLRWIGGTRLRTLIDRLRSAGGVTALPPPAGLVAELRPYQRDGFSWLQFLARNELGGVLADDMGLGKTLQTIAHLLAEKEAGHLTHPALVVCPTSLVPNWLGEMARFAPSLRAVALHGPARAALFDGLGDAEVVVTTYPLLVRDAEVLTARDWHVVVLDEAQAIKNPSAKATQVACRLNAQHRLCLSGTPVENHLGEAWSQFAFLLPGLLGDSKTFTRLFRTPIEKKGDGDRRVLLSSRLKPFLLRRTKGEVAADLPPKTEIVRRLDLSGAQRDLYEAVRLAMSEKVRAEVAAKGMARSHIMILDALLKLRQACCDPRLVKLRQAKAVKDSAKLGYLMEILPALIEDGRRVLLFSQFTSMLDLIKAEVERAGITYVELTGDTLDRAAPVASFQAGAVPLFLISLKAGGVGLNLTAADTVIHYDPWWNPAVEDQATDRAHRIGQDKPVFVYKLIAAGTVEERMLEMQDRKRGLAGALFNPDNAGFAGFEEADLDALFQPLS